MNVSGTMNSATGHTSVSTRTGNFNDGLYDRAGARPDLDLDFARTKSLKDRVSKEDLITFTRSSGNTGYGATYVDENGLVKVSPVNLLKYSEQLDHSTWSKTGTITENNVVAPDGTTTADTWSVDSTRYAFRNDTAGAWMSAHSQLLYPFTITDEWVRYSIPLTTESGQSSMRVYPLRSNDNQDFVYQASIPVTQNTNYVFSAWYKKVGTKVYVWGCQLEKGSVATEYIPTTSQVSGAPRFTHDPETLESKGLLVEQQATNITAQNTDIASIVDSTQGTDKYKLEATAYDNDTNVTNPDGTTGAARISKSANSEGTAGQVVGWRFQHASFTSPYFDNWSAKAYSTDAIVKAGSYFYRAVSSIASTVAQPTHTSGTTDGWKVYGTGVTANGGSMPFETISIFVKKGLSSEIVFGHGGGSYSRAMMFNFDTETVSFDTSGDNSGGLDLNNHNNSYLQTVTAGAEKYPNGWYRLFLTIKQGSGATTTGTGTNGIYLHFPSASYINTSDNSTVNSPNRRPASGRKATYTSAQSVYWWGLQMEGSHNGSQGKFPTSPILTTGTSAVRSPDLASIEGDNFGTYRKNITNSTNHLGFYASSSPRWLYGNTGAAFNLDSYSYENPIDGKHNAALISSTLIPTTENRLKFDNGSTIGPANNHVFSVYVKAVSNPCRIQFFTNVNTNERVVFNLITNNVFKGNTNDSAEIQNVGTDGWKRLIWEPSDTGNFQAWNIHIRCSTDNEARNGGSGTNEFYIYGPQLEEANDVTPYIPSTDTFTNRQSNATFVDGNGIVRTSYANRLLHSEDFSRRVNNANSVSTTNPYSIGTTNNFIEEGSTTTAPDGSTIPWYNITGYIQQILTNQIAATYTVSVYLKTDIANGCVLEFRRPDGSGISETISVTTEWKRFSLTATKSNTGDLKFLLDNRDAITASTVKIAVWGVQIVRGSDQPEDYYKTTGTPSGPPRYSHDPETLTPTGLYLEPAATNVLPTHYSTNNNGNATETLNAATAPDGTQTATRVAETTVNDRHIRWRGGTTIPSDSTMSVFIKGETVRYVGVIVHIGSGGDLTPFIIDTQEGVITQSNTTLNSNTKLVKYPNGWYRFSYYHEGVNNSNYVLCSSQTPTTSGLSLHAGSPRFIGSPSNTYLYWGLQAEAGNTVTSPILSSGAAKTRSADIFDSTATEVLDRANGTKPGYFTTEGLTLRCDCKYNNERQLATLGDGTIPSSHSYNRIFDFRDSSSSVFKAFVNNFATYTTPPKPVLAVYGGDMYTAQVYDVDDTHHLVFRYQQNNSNLRIKNTDTNSADTSMTVGKPTSILIGRSTVNGQEMNGTINRLTIWKIPFDEAKPNPNAGSTMRKLAK